MLKPKAKYVPETKTVYGQDRPEEGLADEMTDVVVYIKKLHRCQIVWPTFEWTDILEQGCKQDLKLNKAII